MSKYQGVIGAQALAAVEQEQENTRPLDGLDAIILLKELTAAAEKLMLLDMGYYPYLDAPRELEALRKRVWRCVASYGAVPNRDDMWG